MPSSEQPYLLAGQLGYVAERKITFLLIPMRFDLD